MKKMLLIKLVETAKAKFLAAEKTDYESPEQKNRILSYLTGYAQALTDLLKTIEENESK